MQLDRKASLAVSPVNYGGRQAVQATFGNSKATRLVSLQLKTSLGWQGVASERENSKGVVKYLVPFTTAAYRAVATPQDDEGGSDSAVTTPTASTSSTWRTLLSQGFDGSRLSSALWSLRQQGLYMGSRMCSAVQPSMVTVAGGRLKTTVDEASASRTRTVRANAAKQKGTSARKACPNGVYDASMVSTEGKFSFRYGTVAARMKFPAEAGQHASVWLQTAAGGIGEIDIIETFGLGWEFQHKLYYSSGGARKQAGGYVKTVPEVKTADWWDEFHVVSVDWTRDAYVFRVDGVETFRTSKGASAGPKFLIISLLASDWELQRIKSAELPTSMVVDWVKVWQPK